MQVAMTTGSSKAVSASKPGKAIKSGKANKPDSAGPGRPGKLVAAARAFVSGLSEQAVLDASTGIVIAIAISLLLIHYRRVAIAPLAPGTVVQSDIIAPETLKVQDVQETSRLRQQAASAVLPIFDYNSRADKDATGVINVVFQAGRADEGRSTADQLSSSFEEQTGLLLDQDQVSVLVRHRFDPELESLMSAHLENVMMNGVVSSRTQINKLGSTGFIRRDQKNGQEQPISDLGSVRDLITARAALRSEKMDWPSAYSARERSQLGEILSSLLLPNLSYNEAESEARRSAAEKEIDPVIVTVEKGKPIVVRGESITPLKAALIDQAAGRFRLGERAIEFAGVLIIVLLLLMVLWQYLFRYQHRHLRVRRHFLLMVSAIAITLGLARLMFGLASIVSQWATAEVFKSALSYDYLTPLAVGALLVTLLTDAQAAFVLAAILSVFVGVLSNNVYLATYTLISSAGAIYNLKGCRDRTALIKAGMWIGIVNGAGALALDLLGANEPWLTVLAFDTFCGFVSGLLATMVASILLPVFEWAFGISTDIKLLELSNLNLPLLRQLAERAPGTYHHSIMVGLLAESAAEAIGADSLFARVACYYHDIGKMVRPSYFVENQTYMGNRHDGLSPRMSSLVLANHVKQGIELARAYKLPPRIISIIPQHHGTGLMKFFYYKARESSDDPDSTTLEQEFRYPGPKPQGREAAIIMIADSVEAAARTIKTPTPAKLRNMIDMIIARIRDDGQLDESNITLREINIVAESFVKVLTGIHHHRIDYPGYDFDKTGRDSGHQSNRPESDSQKVREPGLDVSSGD
jgi:putative nucleotidyltransferase with HDIG domain